jgi:hypothetical protein
MEMRACAYREADVSARETERERENSFESDDESAKRVHERTRERLRAKETSDTHKRNLCNRITSRILRANILYINPALKKRAFASRDIAEKRHVDT